MDKNKIVIFSFIISFFFSIVGALLKIMHVPFANSVLTIGILALAVFVFMCIYEIVNSNKIAQSEKIMWVVGFLFLGQITGLVYLLSGRKRIN